MNVKHEHHYPPPFSILPSLYRPTPLEVEWTNQYTLVQVELFQETTGPTTAIPIQFAEIFQLFFGLGIMQLIVDQTNLYASQVMDATEFATWEQVTVEELKAYFGFMIVMGLNQLPLLFDYWRRDPIYHYSPIASRISRNRFMEISRYLHFVDNTLLLPRSDPNFDKLGKIQPITDHLKSKFLMLYRPTCHNTIDEAMIRFKGRSSLKQYMPKKPVKRGIKVWVRADSAKGFFCDLNVYTGASKSPEQGLGAAVVKRLTASLEGKHYRIFCDDFFSGVDLFSDLFFYACGTLRSNTATFSTRT